MILMEPIKKELKNRLEDIVNSFLYEYSDCSDVAIDLTRMYDDALNSLIDLVMQMATQ